MLPIRVKMRYGLKGLQTSPIRLGIILVISMLALGLMGTAVFASLPGKYSATERLLAAYESGELDTTYDQLQLALETVNQWMRIFFIVGICLTVFYALMVFQFISLSIDAKKIEIAILRALGSSKVDVALIYLTECILLAVVQWGLGMGATAIISHAVNKKMPSILLIEWDFINIYPLPAFLLLLFSIIVCFISALIPIIKTAKKSPVDAIRENQE